jgi:hypothetical protein
MTPRVTDDVRTWWQKPAVAAVGVLALTAALNVLFF